MSSRQIKINKIQLLSARFREAIVNAVADRRLDRFQPFCMFPKTCCGDTSYLLAEYLNIKNEKTIFVSSDREEWSHAWLVLKEDWMQPITAKRTVDMDEYERIVSVYRTAMPEENYYHEYYDKETTANGILIDITGDQFSDCKNPVYVGEMDHFHNSFEFISASAYIELVSERLQEMYSIISEYLNE